MLEPLECSTWLKVGWALMWIRIRLCHCVNYELYFRDILVETILALNAFPINPDFKPPRGIRLLKTMREENVDIWPFGILLICGLPIFLIINQSKTLSLGKDLKVSEVNFVDDWSFVLISGQLMYHLVAFWWDCKGMPTTCMDLKLTRMFIFWWRNSPSSIEWLCWKVDYDCENIVDERLYI